MTRITVDELLRQKLLGLEQPLEMCDASGKVVGVFTPIPVPSSTGGGEPQLSEQELRRREQEPDFSTAEVLARLEKL